MRSVSFSAKEIVIGSSLPALFYSYSKRIPIVYQTISKPTFFDRFSNNLDLSEFNIKNDNVCLKSSTCDKIVGIKKILLWNKLFFNLSLNGLVLCPNQPTSSRLSKNSFTCFYDTTSEVIKFEKAVIFDGSNISGIKTTYKKDLQVLDWMNIRSGSKQKKQIDLLESKDKFVNEVLFYTSKRSGNTKYKDCVAVSYLSKDQLRMVEYTDTYAMFKVRRMMKAAGLKGTANGFYDQYPEKKRHYDIRIDPTKREINKMIVSCYPEEENNSIVFDSRSFEELLNDYRG